MKNSGFEVLFSDDFKYELSNLSFYINYSLSNPIASRKLYYKLIDSAYSLSDFPDRCPVFKTNKSTEDVIRKLVVGKYIITYYVDYKDKFVFINNLLTSK